MKAYKDDFDSIEVPFAEVDLMVEKAIRQGKKHLKRRKAYMTGAAAVLLGLCILGSGFVSSSMARVLVNIPFVGSVFESLADKNFANITESDLTSLENMQITDQGITVAIKEVYYDQSNISIAYLVSGADYSDEKHFDALLSCNGEPLSGGGGARYNQISDKLYSGLEDFYPGIGSELPEHFNLGVVLTDDMEKSHSSPYRFTFPVSRSHADEKTRPVLVMKAEKSSTGDSVLLVKRIVFTPISTMVEYDYTHPDEQGKQQQGQHQIRLINSRGESLPAGSTSWHGEENQNLYTNICRAYFPASNEVKGNWTLELIPARGDSIKVPFTIEQ